MDRTACTEPQCLYKGPLYLVLLHDISPSRNLRGCDMSGSSSVCGVVEECMDFLVG